MASEPGWFSGTVLAVDSSGENFRKLFVFSPAEGGLTMLRRIARKSPSVLEDVFDEAEIFAEAGQGDIFFVREYRVLVRRDGLGANYQRLRAASELAGIFRINLMHAEDFAAQHALLQRALRAMAEQPRPDVTLLKTLFLLARQEGYAAKEQWAARLPRDLASAASAALNQPLAEQNANPSTIQELLDSFRQWLRSETDFILPG